MGMLLARRKKDYARAGSAVTPLLFVVTIILFQNDVELLYAEFQQSKVSNKVDHSK